MKLFLGWFALLVEVAIFVGRTELVAAAFALALTCLSAPSKLKPDLLFDFKKPDQLVIMTECDHMAMNTLMILVMKTVKDILLLLSPHFRVDLIHVGKSPARHISRGELKPLLAFIPCPI